MSSDDVAATRVQPTVEVIQATWATLLGLDAVAPDDDFFELGGHSLLAATAVARLSQALGTDLPLRVIFEAPTPAEMAELLAERLAVARDKAVAGTTPVLPEWVIPLQREGRGRPVFVFPAGHHEMRALAVDAQIAAHVGREHPFFGFRREDPVLDHARQEGWPSLAAAYVWQMRNMQPRGPYLLFGNCAGGYLAWETARLLLDAGEEIAGLLFYEVPLRADFDRVMPGITPAHTSREWHLSLYYRPAPLPVDLTHLMTDAWQARGWSSPWQQVASGSHQMVVMPVTAMGARTFLARRQQIIADHVRDWLVQAESRIAATGA